MNSSGSVLLTYFTDIYWDSRIVELHLTFDSHVDVSVVVNVENKIVVNQGLCVTFNAVFRLLNVYGNACFYSNIAVEYWGLVSAQVNFN